MFFLFILFFEQGKELYNPEFGEGLRRVGFQNLPFRLRSGNQTAFISKNPTDIIIMKANEEYNTMEKIDKKIRE